MDKKILARVQKQAWLHRHQRSFPIFVFALTGLATALSVAAIEQTSRRARSLELDRSATEIGSALQRLAAENIAYLTAATSNLSAADLGSPGLFARFTEDLNAGHERRGALGMGWARRLTLSEVAAFERNIRGLGYQDFRVYPKPVADRPVVAITFLLPANAANRMAMGYDMNSEEVRRVAMDAAARTGRATLSGRVTLIQDRKSPDTPGFLIYAPVIDKRSNSRKVIGYIYSPFRGQAFLNSAMDLVNGHAASVAIYDGIKARDHLIAEHSFSDEADSILDRTINIGDRRWIVSVAERSPAFLSELSVVTLLFGIVTALLLMAIARMITDRASEDRMVLEWLTSQESIRNSLTRELNHRVKNTLANVLSIISLTRRRATDIDDFADGLSGRIRALSATHDLLLESEWSNAPIAEIVRSELAPYMEGGEGNVEIAGPEIRLSPNDALSLGLAIHELATNAAKYGALSQAGGKVRIVWRLMTPELAELHWQEIGGPAVAEPSRRGFGLDLLEKIVAHELNSRVDMRFHPEGVECRLTVPVRTRAAFSLRSAQAAQ